MERYKDTHIHPIHGRHYPHHDEPIQYAYPTGTPLKYSLPTPLERKGEPPGKDSHISPSHVDHLTSP